jgi:hypothetical protein
MNKKVFSWIIVTQMDLKGKAVIFIINKFRKKIRKKLLHLMNLSFKK